MSLSFALTAERRLALRRRILHLAALGFSLSAVGVLLDVDGTAARMGMFLNGVNGYSQFYAIHVGVWFATAGLALLAARQGQAPVLGAVLGDITAMFILAQPAARMLAALTFGPPQGFLLVMCGVETAGGLALLALRPGSAP
jgi:hypothetical protein